MNARIEAGAPASMWAARVAETVLTEAGTTERIRTGVARTSRQEAVAEADAMAEQLGAAVLWFGSVRIVGHAKPPRGAA